MAVRPARGNRSLFQSLESRQLLSTVLVSSFGAIPNDGVNDTPAIQAALNSSKNGDTIYFNAGVYDIGPTLKVAANRTYTGDPGATLRGRTSYGQMLSFGGDNITIRGLTFDGGGLFFDKAGGFNTNITIDNNVFNIHTSGANGSGITFTAGLAGSVISNNYFTGGGFGIYGYNYNGLTIANNEFVNVGAGMHIDAFGNSGNLLVEQNYVTGARGMGFEFQSTASNLTFQDNWYEHPNLSPTFRSNNDSMAFSLILDKSKNITIQRNVIIAPERPDGVGARIGFEVGGDNTLVQDNYINGINHVLAMNDGVGSASVIAKNNRWMNYRQGASNSFPAGNRTLTLINNGSDVRLSDAMESRIAGNITPGRNRRYSGSGTIPTGVSTPIATLPGSDGTNPGSTLPGSTPTTFTGLAAPTNLAGKAYNYSRVDLTWDNTSTNEAAYMIERSFDGTNWSQVAMLARDSTAFSVTNLPAGTKIWFRVRAYGPAGYSDYSNVVTVTTPSYTGGGSGSKTPTTPTTTPTSPTSPTPPKTVITNPNTKPTTGSTKLPGSSVG